ncbi:hypothetical protein C8035_v000563 [Colletotrichum spinosum]|uniref:Uncharacterized protein n=1 Tax=Colletotrichum spinosum TaxID=1347390 RepID=A0A4R8Q9H6_9PEZI|nr:hypothetical protein C8035_v000563 [Colletotrichum spinosum]
MQTPSQEPAGGRFPQGLIVLPGSSGSEGRQVVTKYDWGGDETFISSTVAEEMELPIYPWRPGTQVDFVCANCWAFTKRWTAVRLKAVGWEGLELKQFGFAIMPEDIPQDQGVELLVGKKLIKQLEKSFESARSSKSKNMPWSQANGQEKPLRVECQQQPTTHLSAPSFGVSHSFTASDSFASSNANPVVFTPTTSASAPRSTYTLSSPSFGDDFQPFGLNTAEWNSRVGFLDVLGTDRCLSDNKTSGNQQIEGFPDFSEQFHSTDSTSGMQDISVRNPGMALINSQPHSTRQMPLQLNCPDASHLEMAVNHEQRANSMVSEATSSVTTDPMIVYPDGTSVSVQLWRPYHVSHQQLQWPVTVFFPNGSSAIMTQLPESCRQLQLPIPRIIFAEGHFNYVLFSGGNNESYQHNQH